MKDSKGPTSHFFSRSRSLILLGLLLLVLLLVAVPLLLLFVTRKQPTIQQATPTLTPLSTSSPTQPAIEGVEVSILDNIQQNGFNPGTPGGGLWVNWRYGTHPLQTNINGSGTAGGLGHDPLTDIRYLHNLWLYKSQNPKDTRYDSEIAKYTPIVKAEFTGTTDQRGWLFDEEFLDLYNLSHDTFYRETAMGLAAGYSKAIDPTVGIIYKTNSSHQYGFYRTSDDLEAACALIQAGTLSNNPTWVQQGQTMLNFLYVHAYIPTYHTFADQMDQVFTPSGGGRTINPSQVFYVDRYRYYLIRGNSMRMGSISQMIISLLHTYQVTHNQDYLTKAEDLLDPLSLPENALGMWDTTDLGYFAAVYFKGMTPQQPGSITVSKGSKEAGRQVLMLWAFHLADQLAHNKYQAMEKQMLTVALTKAYYAPGHGVLYQTRPDWTPTTFPNHTLEDMVTTEAMGAELEGLFSLKR